MVILSIIVLSYNTKKITEKCLLNLKENFLKYPLNYQLIVVDNGSNDGTKKMLKKINENWSELKTIYLKKNLGFNKANNFALKYVKGKYILYLNSDVLIDEIDFKDLIYILENYQNIGALSVKLLLPNKEIDPACHRGFPNLWNSFCYFLGLEKFFYKIPLFNRFFGGYHLSHLNLDEIHYVNSISGAFFLTKKEIIDKIGGFDEDYFVYGEDLELSWQINKLGYKILYYPLWSAIHLKSVSGLKKKNSKVKKKTNFYFYQSMKIFYKKHYEKKYPFFINQLVYLAIELKKIFSKR